MKLLTFIHRKEFTIGDGNILTMKALLTIHGEQYVEVYENDKRYKATELIEVQV